MHTVVSARSGPRGRSLGLAVAALVIVVSVAAPSSADAPALAERGFNAVTYNVYLGADLTPLFTAPPDQIVTVAGAIYAQMVQTNFPERAEALADLVAESAPEVVGLQEVALWETAPLSPTPQFTTTYDFQAILLAALEARGAHYAPVATNTNFGGMAPISATTLARFTDHDVILARSDVPTSELKVSNPTSQEFQATLPLTIGGQPIQVPRGWSTVDVKYRGKSYRFANTHLEAFSSVVRNLQARELAASLDASPLPVVLVGDLNSLSTDLAGAYGILAGVGFVDGWVEAMDGDPGFTSGQEADLLNFPSTIDHRIDYVLHDWDGYVDAVAGSGEVIGEEPADRTPSGLWPSDHAGVDLSLRIAQP